MSSYEDYDGNYTDVDYLDEFYRINYYRRHNVPIYMAKYYSTVIGLPIGTVFGLICNILALFAIIRNRLWLKHEGYLYLVGIFVINIDLLIFFYPILVFWIDVHFPDIPQALVNNATCKLTKFFREIHHIIGWLNLALVFNIYLREHLIRRRNCCACPRFAAKYCSIFATRIIISILFAISILLSLHCFKTYHVYTSAKGYKYCEINWEIDALRLFYNVELLFMALIPGPLLFVVILMALCARRGESGFEFGEIDDDYKDEDFRSVGITIPAMTLFSYGSLHLIMRVFFFFSADLIWSYVVLFHCFSLGFQPVVCFVMDRRLKEIVARLNCFKNCSICWKLCPRMMQRIKRGDEMGSTPIRFDPMDADLKLDMESQPDTAGEQKH